jgi:hypothetical protein
MFNLIKESVKTDGNISSMRIVLYFSVFASFGIAGIALFMNKDLTATGVLIGSILVPVLSAKAYQSGKE